jgi:NACalpha-BTF3-like transcription factor
VYAIVAKRQTGDITVNGTKFSRKFSWVRFFKFFGEESMGLPEAEVDNSKDKLAKLLKNNGFSDEELPEIDAVIVFTNKEANLTINEPTIPVLRTNELKSYLREHDKQHNISAPLRSRLIEVFGGKYVTEETTV